MIPQYLRHRTIDAQPSSMGTKKWRFEENPKERYDKTAPDTAAQRCLPVTPGTKRWKKLTGMVATKHNKNRSTGTDTPIVEAMASISGRPIFLLPRIGFSGQQCFRSLTLQFHENLYQYIQGWKFVIHKHNSARKVYLIFHFILSQT